MRSNLINGAEIACLHASLSGSKIHASKHWQTTVLLIMYLERKDQEIYIQVYTTCKPKQKSLEIYRLVKLENSEYRIIESQESESQIFVQCMEPSQK